MSCQFSQLAFEGCSILDWNGRLLPGRRTAAAGNYGHNKSKYNEKMQVGLIEHFQASTWQLFMNSICEESSLQIHAWTAYFESRLSSKMSVLITNHHDSSGLAMVVGDRESTPYDDLRPSVTEWLQSSLLSQ